MSEKFGLYIHIPFCRSKCPYCDFFSVSGNPVNINEYTEKLIDSLKYWGSRTKKTVTSVYFGGGTPNQLGDKNLCTVLSAVFENFKVSKGAEITTELNPTVCNSVDFTKMLKCGFNRLSFGMQSSDESELRILGRKHSVTDVKSVIQNAQNSGFSNISLDLMLGIPLQTKSSLAKSIEFCKDCNVTHTSAYILKIEENTLFYKKREALNIPDDDTQAELYLYACEELKRQGYFQYEISNFSKPGFESKHNLTYWECEEYLGIGPAAHSFYDGKRFYYPQNFKDFYNNKIIFDGDGGSEEEFIMLNLRLSKGIVFSKFKEKYKKDFPAEALEKARKFQKLDLLDIDNCGIRLTAKGFLVSNTIISELI